MPDPWPTILIVEDNTITRAGLAAVLTEQGYNVATAPNGRVALDLLTGGLNATVILLDMLMPEMDGWKFLEHLKQTPLPSVPVIVMTGVGLSEEWAKDNGCAAFLKKPFEERDLLLAVNRALKPA